jgi:hypothetical protein
MTAGRRMFKDIDKATQGEHKQTDDAEQVAEVADVLVEQNAGTGGKQQDAEVQQAAELVEYGDYLAGDDGLKRLILSF